MVAKTGVQRRRLVNISGANYRFTNLAGKPQYLACISEADGVGMRI